MEPIEYVMTGVVLALVLRRVLWRAWSKVDDGFVDEWAGAHGLGLTRANRPMVQWYLQTSQVLRTFGALAGYLLPPVIGAAFGSRTVTDVLFPLVFGGYLAGAVYAELSLVRTGDGVRRVAALVPRELGDYLPRRLLVAQRTVGAATLVMAVVVLVDSARRPGTVALTGSPEVMAAVLAGVAVILAVALPRMERWLLQRPQPFTAPDLVSADNAIRSQSVHSVAGSGLAAQLICLGGTFMALSNSGAGGVRQSAWAPALACVVAALWACLHYGHGAWHVPRGIPSRAAT